MKWCGEVLKYEVRSLIFMRRNEVTDFYKMDIYMKWMKYFKLQGPDSRKVSSLSQISAEILLKSVSHFTKDKCKNVLLHTTLHNLFSLSVTFSVHLF